MAASLTTRFNKRSEAVTDPKHPEEETVKACGKLGSPHVIILQPHIMILSQQTAVHSSEVHPPPHKKHIHHCSNLRLCGLDRKKHHSVYIHDFWEKKYKDDMFVILWTLTAWKTTEVGLFSWILIFYIEIYSMLPDMFVIRNCSVISLRNIIIHLPAQSNILKSILLMFLQSELNL